MKERPILFSGPMVRAILEGRKTQTRRMADKVLHIGKVTEFGRSDTPGYDWTFRDRRMCWNDLRHEDLLARCPYGQPGDRLWVRETWYCDDYRINAEGGGYQKPDLSDDELKEVFYFRADGEPDFESCENPNFWCPSIHMPRWASRLLLEVTEVRVQRLQEINEEDAAAEGCTADVFSSAGANFMSLWERINGANSWKANPWVWCVSFKVLTK